MSTYTPDVWEIIKVAEPNQPPMYKVLAGWYGGYAGSDSWKISSGIDSCTEDEHWYHFHNHSGSVYRCHKESKRTSSMTGSIYEYYKKELAAIDCTMEMVETLGDMSWLNEG